MKKKENQPKKRGFPRKSSLRPEITRQQHRRPRIDTTISKHHIFSITCTLSQIFTLRSTKYQPYGAPATTNQRRHRNQPRSYKEMGQSTKVAMCAMQNQYHTRNRTCIQCESFHVWVHQSCATIKNINARTRPFNAPCCTLTPASNTPPPLYTPFPTTTVAPGP